MTNNAITTANIATTTPASAPVWWREVLEAAHTGLKGQTIPFAYSDLIDQSTAMESPNWSRVEAALLAATLREARNALQILDGVEVPGFTYRHGPADLDIPVDYWGALDLLAKAEASGTVQDDATKERVESVVRQRARLVNEKTSAARAVESVVAACTTPAPEMKVWAAARAMADADLAVNRFPHEAPFEAALLRILRAAIAAA